MARVVVAYDGKLMKIRRIRSFEDCIVTLGFLCIHIIAGSMNHYLELDMVAVMQMTVPIDCETYIATLMQSFCAKSDFSLC